MNTRNFNIRPGDKVLDVGCGSRPFMLATHLADVSFNDNSARFDLPIPLLGRPFFECSVEKMPFGDREFDFVYCSHVLEHVRDPAQACREIMRVGKRGYIECPRSWVEYVFESVDHKWLVDHERNCLIFREKLDEERKDFLGLQYSIFDWLKDRGFRNYWNSAPFKAIRTVEFYWEEKFNYMIIPKGQRGSGRPEPQPKGKVRSSKELQQFLYHELQRQLTPSNGQ